MKLVNVRVSRNAIAEMCITGEQNYRLKIDGLPLGAKLINAVYDPFIADFILTFEHESFDWIRTGDLVPYHHVHHFKVFDTNRRFPDGPLWPTTEPFDLTPEENIE